jgi:large subunit ribosomal protein L28
MSATTRACGVGEHRPAGRRVDGGGCGHGRRVRFADLGAVKHTAVVSRVCSQCGRKPSFGNNRSHSMVATKRRFDPNLQHIRILLNGVAKRTYVCTRCLKGGKVQKAL